MTNNFEQNIQEIRERNQRVELDKAWEVSWTRRLFIATVTYVIAGIWLVWIGDALPWLKAFVPTGGYILSTLSLSMIKSVWSKNKKQQKNGAREENFD